MPPSPHRLLKQILAQHLDGLGARLSFLAHLIVALFKVYTVNLAESAQAFSGRAKPQSSYRRLQGDNPCHPPWQLDFGNPCRQGRVSSY